MPVTTTTLTPTQLNPYLLVPITLPYEANAFLKLVSASVLLRACKP